jgi:tetratricopeptide (TPR) repeat protein
MEKYGEALKTYEQIVQLDNKNYEGYKKIGNVLSALGRK